MIRALFVLPALQSLFAGFVVCGFTLAVTYDRTVALLTSFLAIGIFYFVTSLKAYERYYPREEAPPPPPKVKDDWPEVVLKLENTFEEGNKYYGEVPLDQVQLRLVALRLLAGDTFSMDRWEPWFRGSREDYKAVRKGFLDAHILAWVNPNWHKAGLRITPSGRQWCEALVGSAPPPPPGETKRLLYWDARTRST